MNLPTTYGRLTVLQRAPNAPGSRHSQWLCICDCGTEKVIAGHNLRTGKTRSCGCLRNELTAQRSTCEARSNRLPQGAPIGDGTYKWGNALPQTMGAICRKEKVNYLMVWRKAKKIGLRAAIYETRSHQLKQP